MVVGILGIQPQSIVNTSHNGRVFQPIYENSAGKNRLLTPSLKHTEDN